MISPAKTQVTVLVLTSICLVFLFAVRPIRLIEPLTEYAKAAAQQPSTPGMIELVKAENQKAIDEIKLWIQLQNDWFHYKFILVGAVVAILVGLIKTQTEKDPSKDFSDLLVGDISCLIFALSCVVALAIDMHLRNNIIVVQQLALWIANYAEPALMQGFPSGQASGFLPWEQFLRVHIPGASGMHRDDLYGLAFYPYLHFPTWVIYMVYLWIMFEAWRRHPEKRALLLGSYAMVQATLAIFTWLAHAAPTTFEFKLFPWSDMWVSGPKCAAIYLLFWLFITILNWPFLLSRLWRQRKANT